MGAQDLPRRRSLGERGPANEAKCGEGQRAESPPRGNASSTPCLLRSCLLRPTESTPVDKAVRRCVGAAESTRGEAAVRRKQKETVLSKNMETWGAVNWGAGGDAVNRTRWARGVVPARTRWARGGGSGSDQACRLAWVHSMCRMHPVVI